MDSNFPQLPRLPMRSSLTIGPKEREIWQPDWDCYCCQDTGFVQYSLIKLVIPDYVPMADAYIACQRGGCAAWVQNRGSEGLDRRFDSQICVQLDKFQREQWKATVKAQWQARQNYQPPDIKAIAEKMNARKRDRTEVEELEAQRRIGEVDAF